MIDVENLQRLAGLVRQTFSLERDLVIFDLETTEPNPDKARIVEFGFVNIKLDGTEKVYRTLVNPGVPIPHEASHGREGSGYAGHGITDTLVSGCRTCGMERENEQHLAACPDDCGAHDFLPWPTFMNLAASIERGFSNVDFAGTNIRFDLKVTRNELGRCDIQWDYPSARIVDVYRIEQIGEPRTLSAIYEKYYGQPFSGAHGALADVAASIEVLSAQFKRFRQLPRSIGLLHAMCWEGYIDTDGKFVFANGVPIINFGKNKGTPMQNVDRGFYGWMLRPQQNFAPSTRLVAQQALLGVFPVPPTASPIEPTEF